MKTPLRRLVGCASLLVALCATPFLSAQIYPYTVPTSLLTTAPYNSTGLLFTQFGADNYRGSASVARDARLLYTCAHVIYDDGIWTTTGEFARGWSQQSRPTSADLVGLRGYRYFAAYSGGNSARAFSQDFAIGFRDHRTNFGPVLPVLSNGSAALRDYFVTKLIVGYPAEIEYTGARGYYYMYRTGPYYEPMEQIRGSYHTVNGVSTGGGNSGGPVLAWTNGTYSLAGILISGRYNGAGVYGINKAANSMADTLIAAFDFSNSGTVKEKTATNQKATRLPDASRKYTVRNLKVSKLGSTAVSTTLNLSITTSFRGDIDVYVRAPSGRIHWVHQHALNQPGRNLVLKNADYRYVFYGSDPNGVWNLYMRDFYRGDSASFKKASLTVGTPVLAPTRTTLDTEL